MVRTRTGHRHALIRAVIAGCDKAVHGEDYGRCERPSVHSETIGEQVVLPRDLHEPVWVELCW